MFQNFILSLFEMAVCLMSTAAAQQGQVQPDVCGSLANLVGKEGNKLTPFRVQVSVVDVRLGGCAKLPSLCRVIQGPVVAKSTGEQDRWILIVHDWMHRTLFILDDVLVSQLAEQGVLKHGDRRKGSATGKRKDSAGGKHQPRNGKAKRETAVTAHDDDVDPDADEATSSTSDLQGVELLVHRVYVMRPRMKADANLCLFLLTKMEQNQRSAVYSGHQTLPHVPLALNWQCGCEFKPLELLSPNHTELPVNLEKIEAARNLKAWSPFERPATPCSKQRPRAGSSRPRANKCPTGSG